MYTLPALSCDYPVDKNCWDPRTWRNQNKPKDTMQQTKTFTFKAVVENDLPLLFQWFAQPYIAQLWVEPTDWQTFKTKWQTKLESEGRFAFMAYVGEQAIGYIHYYHVNNNDRSHFPGIEIPEAAIGMDLFIGNPEFLNKGLGTQLIKEFIAFAKDREPHCTTIIIDPATDNHRAIACYKKAGFVTIGQFIVPCGPTGNGPGPILLMMYEY